MRKRLLSVFSVVLAMSLVVSSGCSLFAGRMQPVTITPSDQRADIYVDGEHVGTGTVVVQLRRNRSHGVMAKIGERAGAAHIGREISTTGVLDIVGGLLFLIPFLGVLGPGFWSLDPDHVQIALPPSS